jgi:hypothetical protein
MGSGEEIRTYILRVAERFNRNRMIKFEALVKEMIS